MNTICLQTICLYVLVAVELFMSVEATWIVTPQDCSQEMSLKVYKMKINNEEEIVSHSNQNLDNKFYRYGCDNALTIIGIDDYQFDVEILRLNIRPADDDGDCIDSLKIFNAPRVDNAMILTPIDGLCGSLPLIRSYKTTNNYLTIRFKTPSSNDNPSYEGFAIKIYQHQWTSPGNSRSGGFNRGGWNDGVNTVFQWTWDLQVRVPGASLKRPGQSLEKSRKGIQCIKCIGCSLEEFDLERDAYTIVSGCYICAKQWDVSYNTAQRACYSERAYRSLLTRMGDPSVDLKNPTSLKKILGCHRYSNPYGIQINYCFCDENRCNSSPEIIMSLNLLILALMLSYSSLF